MSVTFFLLNNQRQPYSGPASTRKNAAFGRGFHCVQKIQTCDSLRPPRWAGQCWVDHASTQFCSSSSARGSLPGFRGIFEQKDSIWILSSCISFLMKIWKISPFVPGQQEKEKNIINWSQQYLKILQYYQFMSRQRKTMTMGRMGHTILEFLLSTSFNWGEGLCTLHGRWFCVLLVLR